MAEHENNAPQQQLRKAAQRVHGSLCDVMTVCGDGGCSGFGILMREKKRAKKNKTKAKGFKSKGDAEITRA